MILKINNKKYNIPKFSELTVEQYIRVVAHGVNLNVISYLESFVDENIHDSKVDSNISAAELESLLFDCDPDFQKIKMLNVFNDVPVSEMDKESKFGVRYYFSKYHKECAAGKISVVELCVRALAVTLDYKNQDELYKTLLKRKWSEVLPIGFFFTQKFSGNKISLRKLLTVSIAKLYSFLVRAGMSLKYQWTLLMQR
jgi:hypothetical protein